MPPLDLASFYARPSYREEGARVVEALGRLICEPDEQAAGRPGQKPRRRDTTASTS